MSSLRIVTLNVLHNNWDTDLRFEAIIEELNELNPDFLLLQEVPDYENKGAEHNPLLLKLQEETNLHVDHGNQYRQPPDNENLITLSNGRELIESGNLCSAHPDGNMEYRATYAVYAGENEDYITIFNHHAYWGGDGQPTREKHMVEIENKAKQLEKEYPNNLIILGGDLNTDENSSVTMFLEGKMSLHGVGTLWTDTYAVAQKEQGTHQKGYTFNRYNPLVAKTALSVGITKPEQLPYRRIDYIFVRGWVYGRKGYPYDSNLCFDEPRLNGTTQASDHYGICSDLEY